MRRVFLVRVRIILVCVILFALLIVGRLYHVQILNGEEYTDRAERQYLRPGKNLFDRGSIFFTNKDGSKVSAATIKRGFGIALDPRVLEHPDEAYYMLKDYLPLDEEDFLHRAAKQNDAYEEIAHKVEAEIGGNIKARQVEGVNVIREQWRYYPGNSLASHVIGFVGYDGDNRVGMYGLERKFNDVLTREDGGASLNFFAELFTSLGETLFESDTERDGDLVLTIEPTVQLSLEDTLQDIKDEWGSKTIGGIIINPKTGEIYAMAAYPTYNLNEYGAVDDPVVYKNPLVENVYEMGSIIKPLTMAAGIDAGAVSPTTTYYDGGTLTLDGYTISNFDGKGRGTVSMQEVLSQSLNTGVAYVVDKMGHEAFKRYMLGYGLGTTTGIDLPNESSGIITNLTSPRSIEYATASFGQGIALTPIQTVSALSVLANGGTRITPHVVKAIDYKAFPTAAVSPKVGDEVLSLSTSLTISRMLVEVVDKALRNGEVKKEHYSIAAKTGTAQIAKSGSRGYYDDRYLHSFFGYFPAYDPTFLVFLFHTEPVGARYSSETLTKPFIDLTDFLINYYEVPPDR